MLTKYRGDTFWFYPTVLNAGMDQQVRVWVGIIQPDGGAYSNLLRVNMLAGEETEYEIGVLIPADEPLGPAPLGIYDAKVLVYGEGPNYIDIFEEVGVLEVVELEKQIISVRYA